MDERLKRLILRKAIKSGCDVDGDFIKYDRRTYYVDTRSGTVVQQRTVKGGQLCSPERY